MSSTSPERITSLIDRLGAEPGERERIAEELLPILYDELRELARARLAREAPAPTLQATALVHEAYLRLVGPRDPGWRGSAHFFGAAAEAMRRILIERARSRGRRKRGGGAVREELRDVATLAGEPDPDLLALDEALRALKIEDERKAVVVELRYFAGLGFDEIAEVLELSTTTVKADWKFARAWLRRELSRGA